MQLDQNPYFRKVITPWYDSNFACWVLIVFMVLVFFFALSGMGVASVQAQEHAWFPGLLAFLSFYLVLKVFFRVKQRNKNN
ncbi:hypothetical protein [Desulfospira joergensenii]|uniref:hypothetical protein n=1 Tax=Desulfospira joergensenii TaxID=53329 RepID=UPI0003B2E61C|nr:hypothetical protein [Desulfospira joergensenii]